MVLINIKRRDFTYFLISDNRNNHGERGISFGFNDFRE